MMVHVKYLFGFVFVLILIGNINASYTFNQEKNISYIIRYDQSAYETNITGNPSTYYNEFDYNSYDVFRSDASINDSISFSIPLYKFDNLTLNITQPAVATRFDIVWEYNNYMGYWNGSSLSTYWKPIPNVIDNTNNFTTSGLVSVVWNHTDIPSWVIFNGAYIPSAGANNFRVTQFLIRARITNVTSLTQVPHINYTTKAETYVIVATNEKFSPKDLYTNSTTLGWTLPNGAPCLQNMNSYYYLACDLEIITSNFTISNSTLFEMGNATNYRTLVSTSASNIFTLGNINISSNVTNETSYFKYWNPDNLRNSAGGYNNFNGYVNMYQSVWSKRAGGFIDPAFTNQVNMMNSILTSFYDSGETHWYFQSTVTGYLKNLIYSGQRIFLYSGSLSIDNFILSLYNLKQVYSGVTGGVVRNTDFGTSFYWVIANPDVKATCVDCKFNNYSDQVVTSSAGTNGIVNYTFDVLVYNTTGNVNITDFNLSLTDSLGKVKYSGVYNGAKILNVFEEWNNGTTINYNPYTLTISKTGYYPITQRFNLTYENRYQTFQLGTYPLNITGALKMNNGGGIYIYKC